MRLLVRWVVTAIALAVVAYVVPGIRVEGNGIVAVLAMAVAFGLVNAVIRPILSFLSCGLILITLGLFMIIVNAASFYLAAYVANIFGIGFFVDTFLAALIGSVVVSIVSWVLSLLLPDSWERAQA